MRKLALLGLAFAMGCQSYNMEGVEPQTVVAVETAGDFTVGKAPALLVVQDRSGSMMACFGTDSGGGKQCDSDGRGGPDVAGESRMHVAQRVMTDVVNDHAGEVYFGLVLYGVNDPLCGEPETVASPGEGFDSVDKVTGAYASHPAIVSPLGGTPTTRALEEAFRTLVDDEGNLRDPSRENYVVLVTDGLMNCNENHPMPCVCSQETGCVKADGGDNAAYGESGIFVDPIYCLDDAASVAQVQALNAAGVKTFVIGLGLKDSPVSDDTLNALAEAGGMPRDGAIKYYPATDETSLKASLDEIVSQIVVPCEYELDGPVCDGRLVAMTMTVDGEEVTPTCSEELEGDSWYYVRNGDGSLNPRRITFAPQLCERFGSAERVTVKIRGVENGCPPDVTPACSLAEAP